MADDQPSENGAPNGETARPEILDESNWPFPDDPKKPNKEEMAVIVAFQQEIIKHPDLLEELNKEHDKAAFLTRFCRGYYFNQFKKLPNKERLASSVQIIKRALMWRKTNNVSEVAGKAFPKRKDFDAKWVTGVSGCTQEGRPVYVMQPMDGKVCSTYTGEEAAWLHWQEYEWLLQLKAHQSQLVKQAVLDHLVIVDFGDGARIKAPGASLAIINWFKAAIKWEPPDMQPGEDPMDVDGYCYPESLYRTYMLNTGFAIRAVWSVGKHFLYETTRQKFCVLGSDMKANLKKLQDDGVPMSAIPNYIGGTGLNPPGLLINLSLKKQKPEVVKLNVPAHHIIYYRFSSKHSLTVKGVYAATGKDLPAEELCAFECKDGKWVEGNVEAKDIPGVITVTMTAGASTSMSYEVTVRPKSGSFLACS